ncbi:hypothetical protein STCU_05309 [Strigomonas culicis]|uniref:Membrane-associated protein n=1 Tax=Strigomonas culicis TaxID=28005 RepID=S9UH87_9TRYP|nr:hypothetical protein STCU_05309 [Strigomonas culicis]|eukprot:EPY28084.1 hypothetical protein STCU_05309 [Strigomonas culicis]
MFAKLCPFIVLVILCLPLVACFLPTVHVANITLTNAGTGWPTTQSSLDALNSTATSTMCVELSSDVACSAFFTLVQSAVLALNIHVEVQSTASSYATYTTLSNWVSNSGIPLSTLISNCQTALGVSVSTLIYSTGVLTAPCRGENAYEFLPSCAVDETPSVTFYVSNSAGTIANVINNYICGSTTCTGVTVTTSTTGTMTKVIVSGSSAALEAFLYYVACVRAASSLPSNTLTAAVGDASAGVSADTILLTSHGLNATVFSLRENERYEQTYEVPMTCSTESGFWAFSLIAIPFLAVFLFRYIWYQARHRAKKQMHHLIREDETRIMQGYSSTLNPNGAPNGAGAPGGEQNMLGSATQWYMDANGNYYEAPVADTQEEGAAISGNGAQNGASGASGQQEYQYYVDPATGETYQVPVESSAGYGGDAARAGQEEVQDGAGMMDPNDAAAEYNSYYQMNNSANGVADADNLMDHEMNEANLYHTDQYVDPNNGMEAQGGVAIPTDADAQPLEYYVDPETGVQYAVLVDPSTGETYYQQVETDGSV